MKKLEFKIPEQLDDQVKEAFKVLRTNIAFSGNNIKRIAFTSCIPNEGKSIVSLQTALLFTEVNKRVLYIDADNRNSVFAAKCHKIDTTVGLSHYLSGQLPLEEIIYETNKKNLDIILTGAMAPNPTELLSGELFPRLLNKVKLEYDYILIDCPPLEPVIDAAIIAQYCDGAILVIGNNLVSYRLAQKVKLQLEKSGCHILGAVLNKVEVTKKGYGGRYRKKFLS